MRLLSADYNQVELRVLAHVAGEDVLREIFASGEDVHTATAAEMLGDRPEEVGPERAIEGEDGQLRDRLRALRLRPRRSARRSQREEARALHRALLRALPGGARSTSTRRSRKSATGTSRRCLAAAARSRSCAPGSASAGRWASGSRSTSDPGHRGRHHQAGDGPLPRGARRVGPRDPARAPDPRRAPLRGADRGDGSRGRARQAARCATPSSSTRRWRSTSASARTGWPQSRGAPKSAPL